MKKSTFTFVALFMLSMFFNQAFAQVPQGFNYQAVARNSIGVLLQNQTLGVMLSVHQGSSGGPIVYSESHTPTTNQFGLFIVTVGQGIQLSVGAFNTIDWGTGNYWLEVGLDVSGGTSYTAMGTSQLLSVPYAMYSANSGASGPIGTAGQTLRHDGSNWLANSNLFNDGTNVGIGITPTQKLSVGGDILFGTTAAPVTFKNMLTGSGNYGLSINMNNAERAYIDRYGNSYFAGNLGIGIISPTTRLHVEGTNSTDSYVQVDGPANTVRSIFGVREDLLIGFVGTLSNHNFNIRTNNIERMTVNNLGNVCVNCASPAYKFEVDGPTGTFNSSGIRIQNTSATTGWSFYPSNSGALIIGKTANLGSFDGTTGAYTALSDERLKTDIRSLETVLPSVLDLQLKRYKFINDNSSNKEYIGIIAQDLLKMFPEFVSVHTANDGNPTVENQLGVDYAGLSIISLKAIQEQQAIINDLQKQIDELKALIKTK